MGGQNVFVTLGDLYKINVALTPSVWQGDVAYQNILSQLGHSLDSLSETSRNTPLPAWVLGRLHYIQRQLTELIQE